LERYEIETINDRFSGACSSSTWQAVDHTPEWAGWRYRAIGRGVEMIGELIGLIIFGAVIGALARLVLPGKQNISMIATIILGILGALAGYFLWGALGGGSTGGIDWIRWIISIAVAAVLVSLYAGMAGRRRV
jgi:uncharacterized membrane protein YeaQ/YmgE (transglycosylase-associated protein family)